MIDKCTGEIHFGSTLTVGPNFELSALRTDPNFHQWTAWESSTEQIAYYQGEVVDDTGKPVTVVLSFFAQKLSLVIFSHPIADEPDHPLGPIARQNAFHEQWLLDEVGACPFESAWGWIGLAGSAPPGPAHGLGVLYFR